MITIGRPPIWAITGASSTKLATNAIPNARLIAYLLAAGSTTAVRFLLDGVIPTAKPYYTSHIRQAKQRKGFVAAIKDFHFPVSVHGEVEVIKEKEQVNGGRKPPLALAFPKVEQDLQ
jgi:hypothetical protein